MKILFFLILYQVFSIKFNKIQEKILNGRKIFIPLNDQTPELQMEKIEQLIEKWDPEGDKQFEMITYNFFLRDLFEQDQYKYYSEQEKDILNYVIQQHVVYHHQDDKIDLFEVLHDLETGIITEMLEAFYKNDFQRYQDDL